MTFLYHRAGQVCGHCWHKAPQVAGEFGQVCCWCGERRQTTMEPKDTDAALHGPHLGMAVARAGAKA